MGEPGKKDELIRTGVALLIVGCGLLALTGLWWVLTIDGYSEHAGEVNTLLAGSVAVLLGGLAFVVAAGVRSARRDRAARGTTPPDHRSG